MWKKKIEKELQDGARTKDIYERERMNTDAERKVSHSMPVYRLLHLCQRRTTGRTLYSGPLHDKT